MIKFWHWLIRPYEEWRFRIYKQGWNAGYAQCDRDKETS